jgi:hypothetical protein
MITAIGVDVDPTFADFVAAALRLGIPVEPLNMRAAVTGEWRVPLPPGEPAEFRYAGHATTLHPDDTYFCRIVDLSSEQSDPALRHRWSALSHALCLWADQVPGLVANRNSAVMHNSAKPLHEAILARHGLRIADTITSSDAAELRDFIKQGPAVSKTICGVRADTAPATAELFDSFDPAAGPVHLQRRIDGDDARIHIAGDHLIAQRVPGGPGVDYRTDGRFRDLAVFDPPLAVRRSLIRATADLGLAFAGWDFLIGPDDQYWCLEVNPMPGYSPYDAQCDGAISRMLLHHLSAGPA